MSHKVWRRTYKYQDMNERSRSVERLAPSERTTSGREARHGLSYGGRSTESPNFKTGE